MDENKKYRVIYIAHQKGTYNNFEYDNYVVHCVESAIKSDKEIGTPCTILKFKARDVEKLNPMLWLDKYIEPLYDHRQKLVSLNVNK